MNKLYGLLIAILITGCGSTKPMVSVEKFSGKKIISTQPMRIYELDAQHALGFTWIEDRPKTVILKAGFVGIKNVVSLQFNVDGEIYPVIEASSAITTFSKFGQGEATNIFDNNISYRLFSVDTAFFKEVAYAQDVKMKVNGINVFSTTTFGTNNKYKKISPAIQEFIAAIENKNQS
jgi:hypothetical protein